MSKTQEDRWRNKTILITGAGSGIGKALCKLFSSFGARLIVTDINEEQLETVRYEYAKNIVISEVSDVSKKAHWQTLENRIEREIGYLDVLINNAGIANVGEFEEIPDESFDAVLAVNIQGVVLGCRTMMPLLKKSPRGMIVNISSIFGLVAVPMLTAYHTSKFAVRGFTESLRQECLLLNKDIDIICVMPGGIKTNIANNTASYSDTKQDFSTHFNNIAMTSSDKAASVIEKGMRQNRFRIFIGPDARLLNWLMRLLPENYFKLSNKLLGAHKFLPNK